MTLQQIRNDIKSKGRAETRRDIRFLIRELSKCDGIFSDYITTTYVNAMVMNCI